jgi:hypothetical protein
MGNKDQRSSTNSDKKRDQLLENIIVPPSFNVNSCTMENNYDDVPPPLMVEEIHNIDLTGIDPTPTKIYNELN